MFVAMPLEPDPRAAVDAPVRAALRRIIRWGTLGYSLAVAIVVTPVALDAPLELRALADLALPGAILVHVLLRGVLAHLGRRPTEVARQTAWERARSSDPVLAALAGLVVAFASAGSLLAFVALYWPHVVDRTQLGAFAALGVPALLVLWAAATCAWMAGARDRLARGVDASNDRFRGYWTTVATGHR